MKPEPGGSRTSQDAEPRSRPVTTLLAWSVCAVLAFSGFVALGTWQVKRLSWKLDLIDRVEQRVNAPPETAPGPGNWSQVNAQSDEYRHVKLTGTFLYPMTTRVQATTEYGGGFWLMTPLRRADGSVVLVNRGFVPTDDGKWTGQGSRRATQAAGQQDSEGSHQAVVTGLLRMSQPGGGILRENDAASGRWYSRDVQAIARARGISPVAPYFVDADAASAEAAESSAGDLAARPIGGLTVTSFHNNHLVYAFTWYTLALMVAGGSFWIAHEERGLRRRGKDPRAVPVGRDRVGRNKGNDGQL